MAAFLFSVPMAISYSGKLKDPRWQEKRLRLLDAAKFKCQGAPCMNEAEHPTLHVHHKLYIRGLAPWEYEDWAYQVLCDQCHEIAQSSMANSYEVLARYQSLMYGLGALLKVEPDLAADFSEAIHDLLLAYPGAGTGGFRAIIASLSALSSLLIEAHAQGLSAGARHRKPKELTIP